MDDETTRKGNEGLAIGLVCGSGAATAIGASFVFFPKLVKLASRRVLASSLGISAGVMTYVSFVEIFQKSVLAFIDGGHDEDRAYQYATLTFFGGLMIMMLLDLLISIISGDKCGKKGSHDHHGSNNGILLQKEDIEDDRSDEEELPAPICMGCMEDPIGELEEWQERAKKEETQQKNHGEGSTTLDNDNDKSSSSAEEDIQDPTMTDRPKIHTVDIEDTNLVEMEEKKRLIRMGYNTAFAIALHNFPEGLATFVGTLADPKVGAALAIAIGIHNIPEGLCVALPIYYATGNRVKAFFWGVLSGISEPIAALLGYAVLANSFSDNLYAVMFGFVSGMMVIISVKELLPTAHRYDPKDTVVTFSFIAGMVVIALSLVLFTIH